MNVNKTFPIVTNTNRQNWILSSNHKGLCVLAKSRIELGGFASILTLLLLKTIDRIASPLLSYDALVSSRG